MSRFASVMALWLVGLTAVLAQGQSVPLFRASVDVVELDVTVLDKDRQPVRGLTEKDFTVLEDGKPQAVVAFKAIDLPDVVTSTTTAKWTRSVTPDVTTNQIDNQRLFLIVLDDAVLPLDPFAIEHVKSSARSVINKLGPNDLAAVIFTRDNRSTQDFTNDHAKLLKAVETVKAGFGFPFYDYSIDTLKRATDYMVAVPQQRKTLVYITTSMPLDIGDGTFAPSHVGTGLITKDDGAARVIEAMKETFRRAQRANVNIYSIDACGLRPEVPKGVIHRPPCGAMHPDYSVEFLQTLSDNTGGRAIVNTNDMEPGIVQMFRENNSYYLVGYSPANVKADGTFRRVEVKVDRPDVEVRTRKNYYAPDEKAAAKEAALPQPSANVKALTGMLPKADVARIAATMWT
jgi:VWFA-related protein